MKLVSMVDYILQNEKNKNVSFIKYANFLNRPLELSMFVPCDEDGNVLDEPVNYSTWKELHQNNGKGNGTIGFKEHEIYNEAKERVLFEGFDYIDNDGDYYITNNDFCFLYHYELNNEEITIEDLITNNLTLTESAIKQLK